MQRITISIDDDLAARLDQHMDARGYTNRSEAMRDLVRDGLARDATLGTAATHCVACLSFVFDIETRDLPNRLMRAQHDNHDLSIATSYVPLDHTLALGISILRGPIGAVQDFSNGLLTQRGVSHGALHLIPVAPSHTHKHVRGERGHGAAHAHFKTIA